MQNMKMQMNTNGLPFKARGSVKKPKKHLPKVYGNKAINSTKEGEVDLTKAIIEYLPDEILLTTLKTENLNKFTGITIKCKTSDGFDTYFRCVIDLPQFEALKSAINLSAKETNIDSLGPIPMFSPEQIALHKKNTSGLYRSIMRRTISSAVNLYDGQTRREAILAKRGALKWCTGHGGSFSAPSAFCSPQS